MNSLSIAAVIASLVLLGAIAFGVFWLGLPAGQAGFSPLDQTPNATMEGFTKPLT